MLAAVSGFYPRNGTQTCDGVPLDEYVRATFAVEPRALPPFRRARYDVHVESLPSGNVYSLVFDRSTVVGREDAVLHQAEVEYVHSRTLEDPDVGTMLTELEAVAQWVRRLLASERVAFTEGYYSKLSFLRDTLDRGGAS